jgi:hypothetical protein
MANHLSKEGFRSTKGSNERAKCQCYGAEGREKGGFCDGFYPDCAEDLGSIPSRSRSSNLSIHWSQIL